MGRPPRPQSEIDQIQSQILLDLEAGTSAKKSCEAIGISQNTLYEWIRNDPSFKEKYARARDQYSDSVFDGMIDLADGATAETANAVKLQIETRKWVLGRMKPRKYGDTIKIDQSISGDLNVTTQSVESMTPDERKQHFDRIARGEAP